jgi:uncharacterized membrane protein
MSNIVRELLLFLHLLGAIVWVGGMFFAYFCLRPAASEILDPPKRLPLWAATFERFLRYAAVAVAAMLISGFTMLVQTGIRQAPTGWHVMMTLGVIMAFVFGYVYLVLYPRLRTHCSACAWPAGAQALNAIRRLVAFNLVLAAFTLAAAVSVR